MSEPNEPAVIYPLLEKTSEVNNDEKKFQLPIGNEEPRPVKDRFVI